MTNASHLMIWPLRPVLNRLWALVLLLVLGLPALAR